MNSEGGWMMTGKLDFNRAEELLNAGSPMSCSIRNKCFMLLSRRDAIKSILVSSGSLSQTSINDLATELRKLEADIVELATPFERELWNTANIDFKLLDKEDYNE